MTDARERAVRKVAELWGSTPERVKAWYAEEGGSLSLAIKIAVDGWEAAIRKDELLKAAELYIAECSCALPEFGCKRCKLKAQIRAEVE